VNYTRTRADLDLTVNNSETSGGELFSITHILKVAGLPFIITSDVDTAIQYRVVIASSKLEEATLNTVEKDALISYVSNGGCLIAPMVRDSYLFSLFGISATDLTPEHFNISFDMSLNHPAFRWLNDSLEQTISLGDTSQFSEFLNTLSYEVSDAVSLAVYNDTTSAITTNTYGSGETYALGFPFKSLIAVNQTNRDYEAQRISSNGFEPGSDAVILLIKAICTKALSNAVWLHTSPYESRSTLMVTHDVDATTAFDTMQYYADYEHTIGLSATYMITTHYIDDGCMADYFKPANYPKVQYLLDKGHKLASHSVGHFVDFGNETIAPIGILGNTTSNYLPYDSCNASPTIGSTVLGETEVSKNLLEQIFGVTIHTFRAGHLAFNDKLTNALDTLGYQYNTTVSASDVLTNFPFQSYKDRVSIGSLSDIIEIPLTISDVFNDESISAENYHEKVAVWLDVILRNKANYAPNVLLIHPTRLFKLDAEQELIEQLSDDIMVCDFETYADFWKRRNEIEFQTQLSNDTLTVIIPNTLMPLDSAISFIVDNGQNLAMIKAQDNSGNPIAVIQSDWDDNGVIIHFDYYTPVSIVPSNIAENETTLNCYPNPFTNEITVEVNVSSQSQVNLSIHNLMGNTIQNFNTETLYPGTHLYKWNPEYLASGIYICRLTVNNRTLFKKISFSK
ncbi:MAG: T9SS type A sorting domain-containing protein, partial [Bacteroidia bacterium]